MAKREPTCAFCECPVTPELAWIDCTNALVCYGCTDSDEGAYPCPPERYEEESKKQHAK